jgi:hypothetical protein
VRRTRHRRRFHTDRIVNARRARYLRESWESSIVERPDWYAVRLSYGYLSSTDPWDCGNPRCGICHYSKADSRTRRRREERSWRDDWVVDRS